VLSTIVHGDSRAAVLGNPNHPCIGASGGNRNGDSWISQSIRVPNTSAPQLTVWYRIFTWDRNANNNDDVDRFEIWINNQELFQTANITGNYGCAFPVNDLGWRDFVYDLSAYRGQQITLKLTNVVWPDEAYNTWTFVDDIIIIP
ncbi:MAG: hypothetical protein ABTQ73_01150, partial [Caldilineales bacterium]